MKTEQWDLTALYPSFESKEFETDKETLLQNIKAFCAFDSLPKEKHNEIKTIEHYIMAENKIGALSQRLIEYANLRLAANADDEKALKTIDLLEQALTDMAKSRAVFQKWLSQLENTDKIITKTPLLKEHAYYITQLIEQAKYTLSEKEESILSKTQPNGPLAFSKLHDALTATLMVHLDGEQYPLSKIRAMAYSPDAIVRKRAYEAEIASYDKIATPAAACLNAIKGAALTESKLRGYTSPLHMTLIDARMDFDTLDAMFLAINKSLPLFRRYFLKKAELLGYKEGLPFYELFAPVGKSAMAFSYDEAKAFIIKHFNSFSQKLGAYASEAFEKKWIDVYPRKGKQGGAFCANIHAIGESRILTNFTGSFSDVITLAHELGHGYHGYCLKNAQYLNSDYPMPIAETASTFCETIVKNAALSLASKEDALFILENDISDNAQIIVDITCRYIFEHEVFKKRLEGPLSQNELCQIMLWSQYETYKEGLDKNFKHPYMWVCKTHYYDAHYNYYNFPYAFGLLFSKGLYKRYLKKGQKFIPEYNAILSHSASASLWDVAQMADIDIHSEAFWQNSLSVITEDIKKFIK